MHDVGKPSADTLAFLTGGGEMGVLMRDHDWSGSSLAAPDTWPQSLRSALSICLTSPGIRAIYWGPEFRLLYNDAYRPFLGGRHPWALGRPMAEIWPTMWQSLTASARQVYETGEGIIAENQRLMMERDGGLAETFWHYSFAPIRGESGQVDGIFLTATDTTKSVLAERHNASERERLAQMFEQAPGFMAMLRGPEHVFELVNAAYLQLIGHRDVLGQTVRDALPEIEGQGFFELLDNVYRTGEPFVGRSLPADLQRTPGAPVERRFVDLVYQPITDAVEAVTGIFAEGSDVTERVLAEAELRASEEFNRRVLASSADCIKVLDLDARLEFMSEGGMGVMEVDDFSSVEGKCWPDFWRGEGHAMALAAIEEAKRGGTGRFQGFATTMMGTPRWWDVVVTPITGPEGKPEKLLAVSRDVTATRQAETALRRSEELVRLATDAADVGLWDLDTQTDELFWQPRVKALFGISPDTPVSMPDFYNGVHPEDRQVTLDAFAAARDPERRAHYDVEYRTIGKEDGVIRWVAAKGRGVFDDEGRCLRVLGTTLDITARKAVEERLRELNETLEQRVADAVAERQVLADFVESTNNTILACDFDFRILAINRSNAAEFERVYGRRPKVGDGLLELLADKPEHQAQVARNWGRALAGEEFILVEEFGDAAHERVTYEVRFNVLRDPDGNRIGAMQTAFDVSDRVRAQAELLEAQEALRQSQKMEAVGQLTGGLAHDFNNLLAGISGSLELMATRITQGRLGDVDRYLVAAQGASRRAAALTHRLLAFSRRQTLAPKVTDVNALVGGMEELIRRTVGPQVAVESVTGAGVWPVEIDPNQLENALLNLAINARDAMPDGGRLTIETANRWMDGRTAREQEMSPGQYVSLCVSDTGTGMAPEVVARAFDPFFTTKPIGVGTGLGLSMVYGFARQSGGQVRIYSEVEQGTTVCLYLPRHTGGEAEGAEVESDERLAAAPADVGETVLVIDDEPVVRMLIVDVLEELGYAALEASDGPEGLKVLESKARVDLLITDVGLPGGLNGRQVADAARVLRPALKVLFITGYAENAVISRGQLDKGMHVVTKPFQVEELARRIRSILSEA